MNRITAPALRRGLDILELFEAGSPALRVPEIVDRLGLPRASVHELVGALVDRGYLRAIGEPPQRYTLGVRTFQLGTAYERDLDLAAIARRGAERIAAECGETVQVTLLDRADVVYIVRVDSTHSIRLVSNLGVRLPAHCTAGGKILLSALSADELDAIYPEGQLPGMTERSITSRKRLDEELARARERGWAEEYCESNQSAACVSAAIRDPSGTVAGISISIPVIRWDEESRLRFAQLVVGGADWISAQLGTPHPTPAVF